MCAGGGFPDENAPPADVRPALKLLFIGMSGPHPAWFFSLCVFVCVLCAHAHRSVCVLANP